MNSKFPSREQLDHMSIFRLRAVDITDKEEEDIIQEVLSARLATMPAAVKEVNIKVPDIVPNSLRDNPNMEAEWQKKIDEARLEASMGIALQGKMEGITEEVVEEKKEEIIVVEPKRRGRKPKT